MRVIFFLALLSTPWFATSCGNNECSEEALNWDAPHGRITTNEVVPAEAPVDVQVNGRFYLTDTQLDIQAQQTLSVTASGRICWECSDYCSEECGRCSDPDGTSVAWGLYARIGNGAVFFLGSNNQVQVEQTGRIYLVIPEQEDINQYHEEYYLDNWGAYTVHIDIL